MCFSAAAVANFFIQKSLDLKIPVSNMHLQKMVFFAHAAYYKSVEEPLIEEAVVAWQHGPVIESLYYDLKQYGNAQVDDLIVSVEPSKGFQTFPFKFFTPVVPDNSVETTNFLNEVWNKLSTVDTWRLRMASHAKGGAWYTTVKNYAESLKDEQGNQKYPNFDPSGDDKVAAILPRNLTILDSVIQKCGR